MSIIQPFCEQFHPEYGTSGLTENFFQLTTTMNYDHLFGPLIGDNGLQQRLTKLFKYVDAYVMPFAKTVLILPDEMSDLKKSDFRRVQDP